MLSLRVADITVEFDRDGNRTFKRTGLIDWLGKPVFVLSGPYTFNFDLAGRIQRIDGFATPHSWDWMQRSMANDWVYYDRAWVGQDLPVPAVYVGDSAWAVNGRTDLPMLEGHGGPRRAHALAALDALDALIDGMRVLVKERPEVCAADGGAADAADAARLWAFLEKAAAHGRAELQRLAERLYEIRGRMLVLPPETNQADYRVIVLKVMDGCINHCRFCTVRGDAGFMLRSREDIDRQIEDSLEIYGEDLENYNSVVLGECDALVSPEIEYAAKRAFERFRCGSSYYAGSNLFLFACNRSLLEEPGGVFEMLEGLPFEHVYINVGWEAATDEGLARLGKQQTAADVLRGMEIAGSINRARGKVQISGNFILADGCESGSILDAIRTTDYSGQVYLSPLQGQCSSEQAYSDLAAIRNAAGPLVQTHLYTMQRL